MTKLISIKDQMGNEVEFEFPPKRIISLVPSQSELLWALGLREELVGITKFCIHPKEMFSEKVRVGGTKKLDFKKIESLKPDLIIGNKEENEKSDILKLKEKFPVWMSEIYTLEDSLQMMRHTGKITNREAAAEKIVAQVKSFHKNFREKHKSPATKKRVAYFIWKDPYMVAGRTTFIDHLLDICHFENIFSAEKFSPENFSNANFRYPQITAEQLKTELPELILLSSEPYPFKEKHIEEFKRICPAAEIKIVDGEMFSWYGTRLLSAFDYFESFLEELEKK
jgi:ABC-type Fe3+-hydroxamate transport system substrate-binding protein